MVVDYVIVFGELFWRSSGDEDQDYHKSSWRLHIVVLEYEVTLLFSKMNLHAHIILCFQYHISFIVMAMDIDVFTCVSYEIIVINMKYVLL